MKTTHLVHFHSPWGSKRKGFTLLELILATVMISGVLFGITALNMASLRVTAGISERMRLENELLYLFRDMERNIRPAKDAALEELACAPNMPCQVLQITDADENLLYYLYHPGDRRVSKIVNGNSQDLATNVFIPKTGEHAVFAIDKSLQPPIVFVSLAAQSQLADGTTVSIPAIRKSFLLKDQG